jgi:hypothetical protein
LTIGAVRGEVVRLVVGVGSRRVKIGVVTGEHGTAWVIIGVRVVVGIKPVEIFVVDGIEPTKLSE